MKDLRRIAQIFEANGILTPGWTRQQLTEAVNAAYFALSDPETRVFVQKIGLALDKNPDDPILSEMKVCLEVGNQADKEAYDSSNLADIDFEAPVAKKCFARPLA